MVVRARSTGTGPSPPCPPDRQVKGKVNSIVLDKCSRTGLLFDNVVATVEVVNCQSVEV